MSDTIETTHGLLPVDSLVKSEVRQQTPTGTSVHTEYHLDGELVRRDIHFIFNEIQ